MENSNNSFFGKVTFFLLAFSLLVGFFLNEDASGGGSAADFYNTWGYNIALKENLLVNSIPWTYHFPLHHIILSRLHYLISDQYLLRLFFCIISILLPLLFYFNLKIKYDSINKNLLWLLASLIFILPSFRYSAIWANDHITALIFFLASTIYFLKWEKIKNHKNLDLNIVAQIIFLSLAVYCRQYYAIFFIYFIILYFQKLKIKTFIQLSVLIFILAIPGFVLVYNQPLLITPGGTLNDAQSLSRFLDTLIINSSLISFYVIPIFFFLLLKNKKLLTELKNTSTISVGFFFLFIIYLISTSFEYDYSVGGGFFLKLSILLLNNNIIFYLSSLIGFIILFYISRENKYNFLLFFLIFIVFSTPAYMFQKYHEPLFLFVFFLIINSKLPTQFLKNAKNLVYLYIYVFVYLTSAIINDIFQITKNI